MEGMVCPRCGSMRVSVEVGPDNRWIRQLVLLCLFLGLFAFGLFFCFLWMLAPIPLFMIFAVKEDRQRALCCHDCGSRALI